MKTQTLSQPKAILLITVVTLAIFFAIVPSAKAQALQFPNCEMTRLGCLDKNPPLVPIDQYVVILVGLQVNIKCEALAQNGKNYLVDLHLVKKVQASENLDLNYYLVPGNHGAFKFEINEAGSPEVQQYVMGEYVDHSDIQTVANGLLIQSVDHRATRVGRIVRTTELIFSSSEQKQPLKILSAQQTVAQDSMFSEGTKTSTKALAFKESNCIYY